jgi:hypothetical protein
MESDDPIKRMYAIRRQRLQAVLAGRPYYGKKAALTAALGVTKSMLSQALKEPYPFGEKLARSFEQTLGLPFLWLDGLPAAKSTDEMPPLEMLAEALDRCYVPDQHKQVILDIARASIDSANALRAAITSRSPEIRKKV